MGNSASSLPYSIGAQVSTLGEGWSLHEGQRKSDATPVMVFQAKKAALLQQNLLAPALHHFVHCKKVRHPHILTVHATLDTDDPEGTGAGANSSSGDLVIVTEPCRTLEAWLATHPEPEEIAWGLECVVRSLSFLHGSGGMTHGNLSNQALFVTHAGDVKLFNFALCSPIPITPHFTQFEASITPTPYRSPERQQRQYDNIQTHTVDAYSLGVLVDHLYQGYVPGPLQKAVQRLLTPNPKMRPRLQPLLKCPVFETPYQKLQLQLEEFLVASVEDKIQFWQNLAPQLQAQLITERVARFKLLPMMKQTVQTTVQSDVLRGQDAYRRECT